MTIFRRTAAVLTVLLLLACPRVLAAEQTGSISVRMTWQGSTVPGGSITLYRVAMLGRGGQFVPLPEFSGWGMDPSAPLSPSDARELAEFAKRENIPGQTAALGADSAACFSPLESGLYLLVQREPGAGFLPVNPFFLSVPQQIGTELCYDVDASPKCAPTPTDPGTPGIPQTGQLNWPVPVMALLGLCLMAAGLLLYRRNGHDA